MPRDRKEELVEPGNEFGDYDIKGDGKPVWRHPKTDFQRRVLGACGLDLFPLKERGGKQMRSAVLEVEKAMVPLSSGVVSLYPTEFVEEVISWAYSASYVVGRNGLQGIINKWQDAQWRLESIARHGVAPKKAKDYGDTEVPQPELDDKWKE